MTMKYGIVGLVMLLAGCAAMPLAPPPLMSDSDCLASCSVRDQQCPSVFAAFPERGAIECPAAHALCVQHCGVSSSAPAAARPVPRPPVAAAVAPRSADALSTLAPATSGRSAEQSSAACREVRLRELKHLHDEGLIAESVYLERQKTILSDPVACPAP
jgi:hypothetical protein